MCSTLRAWPRSLLPTPRSMHRLIPYMIVQIEIGGARLCDEDLVQYSISSLLRSNCSVTHFLIRTFIKALPYSFKDIGPLDTLRLTAASLAKRACQSRGQNPLEISSANSEATFTGWEVSRISTLLRESYAISRPAIQKPSLIGCPRNPCPTSKWRNGAPKMRPRALRI